MITTECMPRNWALRLAGRMLGVAAICAMLLIPLPVAAATINFDLGTDGNPIGNDFAGLGVHFGSAYVYYNDNGANGTGGQYPATSNPNSAYGPAGPGTTIVFDQPVTFFSFFYNNGLGPAKFNAWPGALDTGICALCDQILPENVPNGPVFASYTPPVGILSIRFFDGDLTLDNFTFVTASRVPEPASLFLLGLGLAAAAGMARARRSR